MAQMLAPYNNSMRLGQGFNSYTQQVCLDQAVIASERVVKPKDIITLRPGSSTTQNVSEKGETAVAVSGNQQEQKSSEVVHPMQVMPWVSRVQDVVV